MQPVHIEHMGQFGHIPSHHTPLSPVQLAFNAEGTTVCLFSSHSLQYYSTRPRWSRLFFWTPSSFRPPAHLLDLWKQLKISYVKLIDVALPDSRACQAGLLVLLTSTASDHSILCYFADVLTGCCRSVISVRGMLTECEWVYSATSLYPHEKSSTILAESMDLSCSEPRRHTTLEPVTNAFSGCVALGFHQGYVALLDLALDWTYDKANCSVGSAVAIEKSDLLQYVAVGERVPSDQTTAEHITVHFDASVIRWNEFQYKSVSGKSLHTFPSASVDVSCLRYIPNSQTLAVGFSFGGWQLWSLRSMNLEFSLRHIPSESPVTCITFQEPSDDPRFCYYLWVGWQSKQTDDLSHVADSAAQNFIQNAHAKLYQLSYRNRYEVSGNSLRDPSYRYEELVGLSERLSTNLFAMDSQKVGVQNQLLAIQPFTTSQSGSDTVEQSSTIHLVSLIWRMNPTTVRIGLFDLNRWYHAQMPAHIRSDNSFFAVFDADVTSADAIATNGRILVSSISSFWSKVVSRNRQLLGLWDSRASSDVSSRTTVFSLYGECSSNPVPEVCLRPSALSFSFLLVCLSLKSPSLRGIMRLQFASRQEACILSLSSSLSGCKADNLPPKRFDITNWLSEAWATGLLESPGLDPLDEDDLERLLQFSDHLVNTQRMELVDEAQAEQLGFRLTFGDDLDSGTLKDLKDLILDVSPKESLDSDRPRKRAKVTSQCDSAVSLPIAHSSWSRVILSPSWVLLSNCLLEHGHSVALKSLHHLAIGCGSNSPSNIQFRKAWLWLRFQRLKNRFDRAAIPLFDTTTRHPDSLLSSSMCADFHELGASLVQIHHLNVLSHHWFQNVPVDSGFVAASFTIAIEAFSSYTKLVAFFYRLGLLPQYYQLPDSEHIDTAFDTSGTKNASPLLSPYHSDIFAEVIDHLRSRSQLVNADSHTSVTDLILTNALLSAAVGSASHVWTEQESVSVHSLQPFQPTDSRYPPRRLQSVCALWQLPTDTMANNARLGLVGFLLCDAVAAVAYRRQKLHSAELNSLSTPRMLALKLLRNVMSLFAKQFPPVLPLLPTIFTLWLLDRGLFKESLSSQLQAYVTGTDVMFRSSHLRLVNLFSNQKHVLKEYLVSCGQLCVWHQLAMTTPMDSENDLWQFDSSPLQFILDSPSPGDLRAIGAPFLALSQLRRAAVKFALVRSTGEVAEEVFAKAESLIRGTLIELAEACRRAGRLGDLINLGLDESEAETLVEFYKSSGQYGVLFRLLLARKQYNSALSIYKEYQRAMREKPVHELLSSNPTPSADHQMKDLQMLSDMLARSLPECYQDGCVNYSPAEIARSLSLSYKNVDKKSPFLGATYRRYSAVECPLTSTKQSFPAVSMKRDATVLDVDPENQSLRDFSTPSLSRRIPSVAMTNLLNTAKKSAAEFWETFREMEDLGLKFRTTSCYNLSSVSTNESRLSNFGDVRLGGHHIGHSKQPLVHRLFKSIYTPPAKTAPLPRNSKVKETICLFTDSPSTVDQRTPVSILKSPAHRCTLSVPPPSPPSPDAKQIDCIPTLNATLGDDMDITLNMSTVRPSLSATPIVHPHSRIVSTTIYQFSAPKSASSESRLATTESVEVRPESSTFQFVAPLTFSSNELRVSSPIKSPNSPRSTMQHRAETKRPTDSASANQPTEPDSLPSTNTNTSLIEHAIHKPSQILPPWRFISSTDDRLASDNLDGVPAVVSKENDVGESSWDFDDTASIASSADDGSSISSETPRRSGRRVRAPKRFDPSKF